MPTTDAEDVRCCLEGNPEAFRNLVTRYQQPLCKHVSVKLANQTDVAEAAQETMVRAYFSLAKLRRADSFLAWLFGISDRVVAEIHRRQRRLHANADLDSIPSHAVVESVTDHNSDDLIKQAVAELPEPYRDVILRRFYGGQSCHVIATQLGIPLATVTSRLSRAYAMLRSSLRTLKLEERL
ncbi:RNA polymerase sigma factor [Schlesneria sp. DSM 10557]|uniref:RNA polymerase sigma factor n=1 Tax=Schlesneria sp. DSM 10557 TaxID=3044399 RepID=UPI0035A05E8D